jgi:hypothetical protein
MKETRRPILGRFFLRGYRAMHTLTRLLGGVYTGTALGILSQKDLHMVGELKYGGEDSYWTEEYNKRGLWDWERRAVERYFAGCKSVLVIATGGGRELLALARRGMEVDGFESDPGLVRFANDLLKKEGLALEVGLAPWDHCPGGEGRYDGAIVGWGAYMHIRGRRRRVNFLQELRDKLDKGSPILISFATRMGKSRYFPIVAKIGNVPARILGRDRVEVGDCMIPNFAHFFTREEVESELREGGFDLIDFETAEYGHGIGRAI